VKAATIDIHMLTDYSVGLKDHQHLLGMLFSVSCSVEWGLASFFVSYFVTYFVIWLNHMVQEGPFAGESLAVQAGPFGGESIANHDVLL
jgi:hypothetical protein